MSTLSDKEKEMLLVDNIIGCVKSVQTRLGISLLAAKKIVAEAKG